MIIVDNKIKKALLLGNEAVVRGALEAGLRFATTYPGTPATEIGDTLSKLKTQNSNVKTDFYFEYSVNEKVALEAAAGAAFSGLTAMVSMKHYGLNVALDSLLPLAYLECPLVVVVADDPGSWSSIQSEQDSRWFSRLGHLPLLEPSNPQEAKEMTKLAFRLAQKYEIPVLIRLTTRVAHARGIVQFGKIIPSRKQAKFVKNQKGFDVSPSAIISRRLKLIKKMERLKKEVAEKTNFNFFLNSKNSFGLITAGVCFSYVQEINQEFNLNLPIFKIGLSYPFPETKIKNFISAKGACPSVRRGSASGGKNLKEVLVIEEIDPLIEAEVTKIAKAVNPDLKIYGKDLLPSYGELRPESVLKAIFKILKKPLPKELIENEKYYQSLKIEKRHPRFCPGCPHLATLWAIKQAVGEKVVFGGDIGCYLMSAFEPFNATDFIVSMGAGISISHGISKTTGERPVVLIGDSTFFHAGIPALINLVYNKSDLLLVILDNRTTAMTGHQPHPGVGLTGMGEETKALKIEDIVRACGVEQMVVVNIYNLKETISKIKEMFCTKGVSVVVAKGECRLLMVRKMAKTGVAIPKFEIVRQSPNLETLKNYGCPAIRKRIRNSYIRNKFVIRSKERSDYYIDENLCWGCGVCYQLFPENIKIKRKSQNANLKTKT